MTKYYRGPDVLEELKKNKYPFVSYEILVRVRHLGANFDSVALHSYCLQHGLVVKGIEISKFEDGVVFVSCFAREKELPI